ncbi:hypothetical protein P0F65_11505 [Sphingomonas sp. I4]
MLLTAPAARTTKRPADMLGIVMAERPVDQDFIANALAVLDRDRRRAPETPLLAVTLPAAPGVDLYFKDEAAHPTGSLKHRLARSLLPVVSWRA